ncbi:hypothetical protein [Pedobacter sp. MC2016-05]|uniref:hypothetical protein n=1 Tax=Pedobacter sp. MC2016-05 TaxID=2994474 RepID=UPI002247F5D3|nr:hypothetical protein [Pedobacter sp. MC2016-05]
MILIDEIQIGEATSEVIDEYLEAIGGIFSPSLAYKNFQHLIQDQCVQKGISNINDFNYKLKTADGEVLIPNGGIGITDMNGINEIYVETAGLNFIQIEKFK